MSAQRPTLIIAAISANRSVKYDSLPRIGVGITRLGTSEAVAIDNFAFALNQLDKKWNASLFHNQPVISQTKVRS